MKADLIKEFGEELGIFVAELVDISERPLPDRNHALSAFGVALNQAFPPLDVSQRKIEEAFEAISELARRSLGIPLKRKGLIDLIEEKIGKTLFHNSTFPIHIRSDRNEANENALEIDASTFSGGERGFPNEENWRERLIVPLEETARWLRSRSISRIALGGSYRLTTAFILGWAFRSATGFELEIPTRDGAWATDDRVRSDEIYPTWQVSDIQALENERLIVSIGILRNPALNSRFAHFISKFHEFVGQLPINRDWQVQER
ncbi:MAG: SAVED domain-containing protein [Chloroflexota bacterium]|nr:SAVED domain-containing protein [Chloroflexota bacterium]